MGPLKTGWGAVRLATNGTAGYYGALFLSLLLTVPSLGQALRFFRIRYSSAPSWLEGDYDTMLIHDGLVQTPRLVDTLQWWVGTWVGQVPFYRPLTSYVFWIEWKLFGDHEWLYVIPTFAAHALATVLAAAVVFRLAERWKVAWPPLAAVIAAAIFTGLTRGYRFGLVTLVSAFWKNQPDSMASICCFLSLLAYMRAQSADRTWSGRATAWYLAACCFKEIAFPLPLACLALEITGSKNGERRRAISRGGVIAISGALLLLFRYWAIGGIGYLFGSNSAWFERSLLEFLGPFSSAIPMGHWPGAATALLACGLIAIWWRTRARWQGRRFGAIGATIAVLLLLLTGAAVFGTLFQRAIAPSMWQAEDWEMRFGVAILLSRNSTYIGSGLGILFMAAVATAVWKQSRAVLAFAPWWTLVFLAPLTVSPGPSHRYYLPEFGYILLDALGCCALLSAVSTAVRNGWRRLRSGETSGKTGAAAIQ